jgi:arylsulfatase A-like enzyme
MTAPAAKRLNILWISLEDTSPRFGCYSDTIARTPNIDRLAAEGRRFPLAFSTAGVCAPSRSAIITGMYQTSIGTHHMRTARNNRLTAEPLSYEAVPPHYVKCLPEYLRAAGYFCTNNEKTDYQFAPPFTMWDQQGRHAHWRSRPDPAQPFFAVFNPTVTHESGMWPTDGEVIVTDPDRVSLPPYLPNTPKARLAVARHYDNLAKADELVGEILRQLDDDGLADNTIVVLWSDHGEGLPRGKRWPYDAGIRIPLIVRWPGGLGGDSVGEQLVSLLDLAPTMLSLAGLPVPCHLHGQPFLGPQATAREYVFATRDRHDEAYDMVRAVRDRRYKYLRHFRPDLPYLLWGPYGNRHPVLQEIWRLHAEGNLVGPQNVMFEPRPAEELYDTESDPFELHNLAGDRGMRETLLRMRAALDEWRQTFGDLGEESEDQMMLRMWPGGVQPRTAAPVFVPITPDHPGLEASEGGAFPAPLLVQLHCATQGASLGYTLEEGDRARWRLYTGPLHLGPGQVTLRAKAIRIGYAPSDERTATFRVHTAASGAPTSEEEA